MTNLTKLEFVALYSLARTIIIWLLDYEIHLNATSLGDPKKDENKASKQNYAKAIIFCLIILTRF